VMLRKQVSMTLRAKRNGQWKQVGVGTSADEGYVLPRKPFEWDIWNQEVTVCTPCLHAGLPWDAIFIMGGPIELLHHRAGANCVIQRKVVYVECEKDPNRMVRQQQGGNEKVTDLKNGADYISTHFPRHDQGG
jgi:hypothetical protein